MEIDRALVKSQAKQLIKGNIFKLFIIGFIVGLIFYMPTYFYTCETVYSHIKNSDDTSTVFDYFDNFGKDDNGFNKDYFNQFGGDITVSDTSASTSGSVKNWLTKKAVYNIVKNIVSIVSLFMSPLVVGLYGFYLKLIKGQNYKLKNGIDFVFSSTFDSNYIKKLALIFVKRILTCILTMLFIIPGIIFSLKYFFAAYVMAENPEMSMSQAMHVSKKLTDGHKGELFRLFLSFFGWFMLATVTLGVSNIYSTPYIYTVSALYYENFKGRAIAEMRVNQFDFMTPQQRIQYYYQQQAGKHQYQNNNNQSSKTDYYNNIHF